MEHFILGAVSQDQCEDNLDWFYSPYVTHLFRSGSEAIVVLSPRCCESDATFMRWFVSYYSVRSLQWRHNECNSVSNHQPHDCLFNWLCRCRSKKTSKLRVTGLCAGNSPITVEFPAQRASNAENVSIWWRHHVLSESWWRHDMDTFSALLVFCVGYRLIPLIKGQHCGDWMFSC